MREAVNLPVAAYNVGGEYAMVEAAAANGWINRDAVINEALTSIPARRCRCDLELLGHGVGDAARGPMTVRSASSTVNSEAAFERAQAVTPGGVNSPVRAFDSSAGTPRFIARAGGAYLYDIDGNELRGPGVLVGPMLLSHAHPEVIRRRGRGGAARNLVLAHRPSPKLILLRRSSTGCPSSRSAW